MSRIYFGTIPEEITGKMKTYLERKLTNNRGIFKYNTSDLRIHGVCEYNWFGNITANGIVNKDGITNLKIKSLDSVTGTTTVFYQDTLIASYMIIYFDDDNIVIPDFEFITNSMNLSICSECRKHKDKCVCNEDKHSIDVKVKEILTIVNTENLSKTTLYDPDELINTERRIEVTEDTAPNKVDLTKFEPIIKGICTTLRYNQKKVEEVALNILTSNPDMPDNQLATEIIRKIKG